MSPLKQFIKGLNSAIDSLGTWQIQTRALTFSVQQIAEQKLVCNGFKRSFSFARPSAAVLLFKNHKVYHITLSKSLIFILQFTDSFKSHFREMSFSLVNKFSEVLQVISI